VIPCTDPLAQYLAHKDEIDAAIAKTLASGWYILGDEVAAFEADFARWLGTDHAVGVGNGTEALHLAMRAIGVGPGDEVITVAHTAVATVAAIEMAGAVPVLVDIAPDFYTLDPAQLERAITPKTKAVIPVHLYGQSAELTPILEIARAHGVKVIEDCAQAHGATYHGRRLGALGDLGCFSFYPTKNLGAIGDGGMVVTSDPALAERVRLLRQYGWADRYISSIAGVNSRLDVIQAAILRVKLRYLDADNAARRRLAQRYDTLLRDAGLRLPQIRAGAEHVYHLYVVRSPRRDQLLGHLKAAGVSALIHYPMPVHRQPAYVNRLRGGDSLPVTDRVAGEVLSLPMYPELAERDVVRVADAIHSFVQSVA
jgi:dTDP-4-amino-4,6-dideoxygalactose transaminase